MGSFHVKSPSWVPLKIFTRVQGITLYFLEIRNKKKLAPDTLGNTEVQSFRKTANFDEVGKIENIITFVLIIRN